MNTTRLFPKYKVYQNKKDRSRLAPDPRELRQNPGGSPEDAGAGQSSGPAPVHR